MLSKIDQLKKERLEAKHQLDQAQEELQYQKALEEKAQEIEQTNARLTQSLQELSLLFTISQSLTSSMDSEELCHQLSCRVLKNMKLDGFAALLVNEASQSLEPTIVQGFRRDQASDAVFCALDQKLSQEALRSGQAIHVANTAEVNWGEEVHDRLVQEGSFLCLPMVATDDALGVLNFYRREANAFSKQEIKMLKTIAGQMSIALENARLYAKTKELSLRDDLTQVHNRRYFHEKLQLEIKRARRFDRVLSILMLDVDHFKKFNDTYGHCEGDRMLIALGKILSQNLREVDTLARYGGEEFAVILPNRDAQEAEKIAFRIKRCVSHLSEDESFQLKKKLTISIGIAVYPNHATSYEDLIRAADMSLYQAKAMGRDCVVNFALMDEDALQKVKVQ